MISERAGTAEQTPPGLTNLRKAAERFADVNSRAMSRLIAESAAPLDMAKAYGAIGGFGSGEVGRAALRRALEADRVSSAEIDSIDALYVHCLLDPLIGR